MGRFDARINIVSSLLQRLDGIEEALQKIPVQNGPGPNKGEILKARTKAFKSVKVAFDALTDLQRTIINAGAK